jgi:hypothetical protein
VLTQISNTKKGNKSSFKRTWRLDLGNDGDSASRAGLLNLIELIASVGLVPALVQPIQDRIVGPESEGGIKRHLPFERIDIDVVV